MTRGAFIVIEGLDRSGKTTQIKKLIESLKNKGVEAESMEFPDRTTEIGKILSKYLTDKNFKLNKETVHLLYTANRWENVEKMKKKLDEGVSLIVSRYFHSGVAYSAAKGMCTDWCWQPEIGLLKPDEVFFLKISLETQMSRPEFGEERYETSTRQQKVLKEFEKFEQSENNWKVIDGNRIFDEVHEDLFNNIVKTIEHIADTNAPFNYLIKE